jgi:hypothetical protein
MANNLTLAVSITTRIVYKFEKLRKDSPVESRGFIK